MDSNQPNPAELQLYPHATMSERAAESILPPTRQQLADEKGELSAAAAWHQANEARRQAAETDAAQVRRELAKYDAAERKQRIAERFGDVQSYLIHEHKASTSPGDGLDAAYDSTHDAVAERLQRMTQAREWSLGMAAWIDDADWDKHAGEEAYRRSDKLRTCGSYLVFHELTGLDENRLAQANFCQQPKLCPLCAMRRAAKEVQAHAPTVIQVVREERYTPYMLTLTVKGGADLSERLEHLTTSWRKLIKKRRKVRSASSRNTGGEVSKVEGGRYAVEIKRGSGSGQWHPHLHAVVLTAAPLDADQLAAEWHKVTGDSFIVDVRPMHNHAEAMAHDDPRAAAELIASDLVEVLKYPLKFGSMTHADTWHAFGVASGKRLSASFGCLRNVEVDPSYLDDAITGEDWPFVEVVARWMFNGYHVERGDDWGQDDDAHAYYRDRAIHGNTRGVFSEAKATPACGDLEDALVSCLASPHTRGGA